MGDNLSWGQKRRQESAGLDDILTAPTPHTQLSYEPPRNNSLCKKVPLQLRHLVSNVFAVQKSQKDGKEKKHLVDGEPLVPKSLPLPSPPPQAKVMSLPALELDDVTLL